MIRKAQLLFRTSAAKREALANALIHEGHRLFSPIEDKPKARLRVDVLVPGLCEKTVHGERMGGKAVDCSLEVGFNEARYDEVVPLVDGLGKRLGADCDCENSYALVGTDYPFAGGVTDTVLLVAMSRELTMNWEDYHRYWLNRHGWVVKPNHDMTGTGYGQFHVDPKASELAAKRAGVGWVYWDGVVWAFWKDQATYIDVLSDREGEVLSAIWKDEENFIDFKGSAPGLYKTVLRLGEWDLADLK